MSDNTYTVILVGFVDRTIGEYEAESADSALELAESDLAEVGTPDICHHCSRQMNLGDWEVKVVGLDGEETTTSFEKVQRQTEANEERDRVLAYLKSVGQWNVHEAIAAGLHRA